MNMLSPNMFRSIPRGYPRATTSLSRHYYGMGREMSRPSLYSSHLFTPRQRPNGRNGLLPSFSCFHSPTFSVHPSDIFKKSNMPKHSLLRQTNYCFSSSSSSPSSSTTNDVEPILKEPITKVTTKEDADKVLKVLYEHPEVFWACDTEVADIDVKNQGPVGNGKVTCISLFGGPDIDFGLGQGPGSVVWIDNIEESEGLLQLFKPWFEDSNYKKVWHNYGFDRHVMYNEGIDCLGFGGDTMHMARVWNTSLDKTEGSAGYSLSALSSLLLESDLTKIETPQSKYSNSKPSTAYTGVEATKSPSSSAKESMMALFGVFKLTKAGKPSKVKVLPSVWELQTNPVHRDKWIQYSAKDAVCTYYVHAKLSELLKTMRWEVEGVVEKDDKSVIQAIERGSMYDYYMQYLLKVGELLTDMERIGIKVDVAGHIADAEKKAVKDKETMRQIFVGWLKKYVPNAELINTGSSVQLQQLFFGHYKDKKLVEKTRRFSMEKNADELQQEEASLQQQNKYAKWTAAQLKEELKRRGLSTAGKKACLLSRLLTADASPELEACRGMSTAELRDICLARGLEVTGEGEEEEESLRRRLLRELEEDMTQFKRQQSFNSRVAELSQLKAPKRIVEFDVESFLMKPKEFTPAGVPKVSSAVIRELSGSNVFSVGQNKSDEAVYGSAYNHFGGGEAGEEACRAVGALANISQVDTMLSTFLIPLQALADESSRIHCSLNLNTETGRLSSRQPNLQNQPALEKDQYKIRDAFQAEQGNALLVADYGQLELRLLAHMTQCQSMLRAFEKGGCFHSRTAVGMYPHIQQAVERGEVLLEWDYSKGAPPKPLVKDVYGSERRKAKTLNFSIAYGKTIHGLAKDWGISTAEAQETLEAWYRDRPEVRQWQQATMSMAKEVGFVRTIMGRRRNLKDANSKGAAGGHALRAAINTPIQGSAADVVMMAMIRLWESQELKRIGWKMLLQIHDEVILEGPEESKELAMKEVLQCMQNPFDGVGLMPLSVKLEVDAKCAKTWYEAK